jgi:hypothetical protein
MDNSDLLREIKALRDGQEKLLALVESRPLTESVLQLDTSTDLGRIYRTQGVTAFKEALREQNRMRTEAYRKRGIAI